MTRPRARNFLAHIVPRVTAMVARVEAGAVTDRSFLALYNDQSLRTLIIAGRPDLGHPGWHDYPGKAPLASAQVSDLVAWLAAQRQS